MISNIKFLYIRKIWSSVDLLSKWYRMIYNCQNIQAKSWYLANFYLLLSFLLWNNLLQHLAILPFLIFKMFYDILNF